MSVPGRRSYTRFSVKTQGTGVKADIHRQGNRPHPGDTVRLQAFRSGVLRPGSDLQFIWTNQTSVSLYYFDLKINSCHWPFVRTI